jgi:hypothetical protein
MTQDTEEDSSVPETICRIVNEKIAEYGQFVCDLSVGLNSDGEESIFIEICYIDTAIPVPADVTINLRTTLRDELWNIGEKRFPYLSYLIGQTQQ